MQSRPLTQALQNVIFTGLLFLPFLLSCKNFYVTYKRGVLVCFSVETHEPTHLLIKPSVYSKKT